MSERSRLQNYGRRHDGRMRGHSDDLDNVIAKIKTETAEPNPMGLCIEMELRNKGSGCTCGPIKYFLVDKQHSDSLRLGVRADQ